jgi:hypothetical protein
MENLLFYLKNGEKLSHKLQSLSESELRTIFNATIFERGVAYANDETVRKLKIESGKIKAKVMGSEKYKVQFEQRGNGFYGDCDCPFDGRCKHLSAALMYIRDETDPSVLEAVDTDSPAPTRTEVLETYLNSLTVDELKALVRKFAPSNFEQQIALQLSAPEKKDSELAKIKAAVNKLFSRDLYDIGYFEEKIDELSERLRPIWSHLPQDVAKLYALIIKSTNTAFENGYLYDDYSDGTYSGDSVGSNMAEFLNAIPQKEVEKAFLTITKALDNLGYTTFDNFHSELWRTTPPDRRVFNKDLFLKHQLLSDMSENEAKTIFEDMRDILKDTEVSKILESLQSSPYFLLEWSKHLEELGELKKSIKVITDRLEKNTEGGQFYQNWYHGSTAGTTSADLFERRLDLDRRLDKSKEVNRWTKSYIGAIPTVRSLRCAITYTPQYKTELEVLLEVKNAANFAEYLEEEKRLTEVLEIFKKYNLSVDKVQYPFFKRHKATFPTEALAVFEQILKTNLEPTGNDYYRTVVEVLQQIQALEDKPYFAVRVREIRGIYNRRRNLIQYLNDARL